LLGALVVRLSTRGYKCPEIATLLGLTVPGVLKIVHRFNTRGLPGLAERQRPGRPSRLPRRYLAALKKAAAGSPQDLGYPFKFWTLNRLRKHLQRETGVLVSRPYLSQLKSRHKIKHRRPPAR
jgi:transposase